MSVRGSGDGAARPPWLVLGLVVVLAMVVRLGLRDVGLISDDFEQQAMIEGWFIGERSFWDLYRFYSGDPAEFAAHRRVGSLPWWTSPDLRGAVFRPLASILLHLDHALAPRDWVVHHLHSLLWWGLTVLAAGLVLCRTLGSYVGVAALLLLAFDPACIAPLSWLANRCVLESAALGFFALWVHLGARTGRGRASALVLLALSLAAGEYGLVAAAYFVAHGLVHGDSWRERMRGAAPAVALSLIYLVVHQSLGYGNNAVAVYVDPIAAPAEFVQRAAGRLSRLCGQLSLSLPASSLSARGLLGDHGVGALSISSEVPDFTRAHAWVGAIGTILVMVVGWLMRGALRPGERRTVAWLGLGLGLGLLPLLAAPSHGRLLVLALLGASGLVAMLGWAALRSLREEATGRGRRVLAAGVLTVLFVTQVAGEALANVHELVRQGVVRERVQRLMSGPARHGVELEGADVIVMSAALQTPAFDGVAYMRLQEEPVPRSWQTLSVGRFPYTVTPLGDHALELRVVGGIGVMWMSSDWERFFRVVGDRFAVDRPVESGDLTYTVLELGPDGPTRIRLSLERPISEYVWLVTGPTGLEPFAMPDDGRMAIVSRL